MIANRYVTMITDAIKASPTESQCQQQRLQCIVTLIAKWGKEKIELSNLSPTINIGKVKELLCEKTNVLPKRQKLIGLTTLSKTKITDQVLLSELKPKGNSKALLSNDNKEVKHTFILMGTPEEKIFIDPDDNNNLPDVVDDFDLDYNAGSQEWRAHVATGQNLKKFTESTEVHLMNDPREGKPLMVLDLDHTLLDFSRKSIEQASTAERVAEVNGSSNNFATAQETITKMKRPFMDKFLAQAYQSYDLVVWSQTSWRWLETKLIELGMLTNAHYRFCFVLDKTSMFAITSTSKSGRKLKHAVKPLQIIWNKFPRHWGPHNTVHLDDLSRNFALNPGNGLKVTAFYRKKKSGKRDVELLGLASYLKKLASEVKDFMKIDLRNWKDVVSGNKKLLTNDSIEDAVEKKGENS